MKTALFRRHKPLLAVLIMAINLVMIPAGILLFGLAADQLAQALGIITLVIGICVTVMAIAGLADAA
jgi:Ca2+/Na+ antiporter